jgi:hypothetical protein
MHLVPADTLGRAVLATLAWFDGFGYPLSALECWRWLRVDPDHDASVDEVASRLDALVMDGAVQRSGEWFALAGGARHAVTRKERATFVERKLRRAQRFARLAALLPFVTGVFAVNSLGYANADDDSDIDLFVVTAPGTAWCARLVLAGTLALLRLRPTPTRTRDMLCLSFIVDEANLGMARFALPGGDPYLAHWCAALLPLIDKGGVGTRFAAANCWVVDELPNAFALAPWNAGLLPRHAGPVARACCAFAQFVNPTARRVQERYFPSAIRQLRDRDTRVVIEDGVLKLHVDDRREEFRARYQARLRELGLVDHGASVAEASSSHAHALARN